MVVVMGDAQEAMASEWIDKGRGLSIGLRNINVVKTFIFLNEKEWVKFKTHRLEKLYVAFVVTIAVLQSPSNTPSSKDMEQ